MDLIGKRTRDLFFYSQCIALLSTDCKFTCDCRGITEARLVYVCVSAIMCLAVYQYGHCDTQPSDANHTAAAATTNIDVEKTMYRELKLEADATPAVVLWHHVHTAWLLLMLLLARPHNISLIAIMSLQNVCCRHIVMYLRRTEDCVSPASLTLLYLFNGQTAFFYQVL